MSYVLRITNESIEKIDNSQFPGSEHMKKDSDLLVPQAPKLKMPKLNLKIESVKEHGGMVSTVAGINAPEVQPMGVYGRLVKMPSLKLKTKEAVVTPMGTYGRMVKMPSLVLKKKEADSGSSFGSLVRANESRYRSRTMSRFMESVSGSSDTQSGPSRYQVTLICEGLGNLGDGFYYTANALQAGAPKFEGQKCFANHPSSVEEQVLPERSVRDIIGHFENVQCVQNGDHAEIQGQLVVMGGPDYAWVQSQLDHALDFSQKYTDKDFVGLSINAGGQAQPMDVQQFLASNTIPASCMPKIESAMAEGLKQVKVVDQITEAISCDLVTQAGAGGRIIQKL